MRGRGEQRVCGASEAECGPPAVRAGGVRGRVLLVCLVASLLAIWVGVGRSWGSAGHGFVSSLVEAPVGSGLVGPGSVVVDRASGDVFVGDWEAGFVDVFDGSGKFLTRFGGGELEGAGLAVDEGSGDVYVADPFDALVVVFEPDGKGAYRLLSEWEGRGLPETEFGEVTGVAVDNSGGPSSGDVYVVEGEAGDVGAGVVDVYKPATNPKDPEEVEEGEGEEGQFLRRLSGPKLEEPNGIVVSPGSGRVLVADGAKGMVVAYSSTGVFEEKITGKGSPFGSFKGKEEEGNVAGLGVDEASGEIYVAEAERHVVSQYSPSGAWEGWISRDGEGPLGEPRAVTLAPGGDVYVADVARRRVDRFDATVVVPDVETGKVAKSGLTRTIASLAGTINGDGKPATYRFQYGETEALDAETAGLNAGPGEAKVSNVIEGLHAGRGYFYRIVGENENGQNYGLVRQFTTPPAVEGLSTGAVKSLQPESVTLTGKLTPGGFDAHYYFEYGTTASYGQSSPTPPGVDAGSGALAVEAESGLSGLKANTLYHYRLIAENSFGTTSGEGRTFTTSGPPRITSEPVSGIGHNEATLNAKINPDQIATTYHFEYGETTAYGNETPLGGTSIGAGASPVPVTASLSGLKIGATYHYRIVASNTAGTTIGSDQSFTTIAPAPVDATYATEVTGTTAILHAQIDPLGNPTSYQFQYGTQSCRQNPTSCTSLPDPAEEIGSGNEDVPRTIQLTGLQPNTTYHYRVLASNILGTTQGPEHTLTTQEPQNAALPLPDGRAWEMVTPPDKQGAPVEALTREGGLILASEDGSSLTYVVNGALGENVQGNRSPEMQQVIATRTPTGWSSQDIATPSSKAKGLAPGNAPEYQFFSSDLSQGLAEPFSPSGRAEPPLVPGVGEATVYLRDSASGAFSALVSQADTAAGTQFGGKVHFLTATPDLARVVIASTIPLTGAGSAAGLYEWADGQLRFVSVLPDGVTPSSPAELGFFGRVLAHAVSDDGSRVIWTKKEENTGKGHLYLRDVLHGETVQLDAAQGVGEPEKGSAQFQTATGDGSRVLFTDKQRLTPDSTAEPGQGQGKSDLYECAISEVAGKLHCALTDLTVDENEGEHAAVQNFIFGASGEGSSIYLVAQGVLAGNANGNGETAQPARNNLYHLQFDGSHWTRTFIATLSGEDGPEWEGGTTKSNSAFLTARVSPNGRYLAFMSAASITGYDNVDANPAAKGARDEEVFLYDAGQASLRCVSCNPAGARPNGVFDTTESGEGVGLVIDRRKVWAELGKEHWLAGSIPGWTAQSLTSAVFQSRYLSDEGWLYFDSPDNLVPAASNAKSNVYEYEPDGVGSCQSPSGGCVSLLSAGDSTHESAFIEATPDGRGVFFVTAAQLLSQDTDTAFDIYEARQCSQASPCLSPPSPPAPVCGTTETCRPSEPGQPLPGVAPPSGVVSASQNIVAHLAPAKQGREPAKVTKPLTRVQKLSNALKSCRKHFAHAKRKRKVCERAARKYYGPAQKAKKQVHTSKAHNAARAHRSSGRSGR